MKPILYSFPPGTGGDHVCGMLMNQPLQLDGRRARFNFTIRHAEHLVRSGQCGMTHYIETLREIQQLRPTIINSHEVSMSGIEDMTQIRAVWTTEQMSWVWLCRDIMLNQWQRDVMPYIDTPTNAWLKDHKIPARHRLLRFLRHQFDHGRWQANEPAPGWHRFHLDRFFTDDFVEDVSALADLLGLELDVDLALANHREWLQHNRIRDFTAKKAVRYLESQAVLDLL